MRNLETLLSLATRSARKIIPLNDEAESLAQVSVAKVLNTYPDDEVTQQKVVSMVARRDAIDFVRSNKELVDLSDRPIYSRAPGMTEARLESLISDLDATDAADTRRYFAGETLDPDREAVVLRRLAQKARDSI